MSDVNGAVLLNQAVPGVKQKMGDGKTHEFILDYYALLLMEDATGLSALENQAWRNVNGRKLLTFLWACCAHEYESLPENERLKVTDIAKWFGPKDTADMFDLMNRIWDKAWPVIAPTEEAERPLAETESA